MNIALGCNAPKLIKLIRAELQLEKKSLSGDTQRTILFDLKDDVFHTERNVSKSDEDEDDFDAESEKNLKRRNGFYCGDKD